MQHRGEIIKNAVYKSGFSITELAKRLGKSRRWVYLMFENPSVSLDVVLQLEKIIHYNFSVSICITIKNKKLCILIMPLKKYFLQSVSLRPLLEVLAHS
jgi:predicted transcriptional regulator